MGFYYARVMRYGDGGIMVAIADEEVIDRAVIDDESGVRIIVSRDFYGDKLVDDREVLHLMEEADVLVLTGSRIISKAIELGFVHPDSVLEIKGVKHVQVFKFMY